MEVSKRDKYEAWIFTLGNEVVEGRVVNTNAAYLGRRLTLLGYNVVGNISLIDDVEIVSSYLRHVALNHRPSIIVTTGGLGPTYDDRTLEAVAKAFNRKLILNEEALRMVIEKYSERNMPITEERKKMAYLPEGSIPIPNPVGTAPGSWLEVKELNLIVISLPGVPRELEAMWEGWVEERLRIIGPKVHIVEASFTVVGVPESSAAKVLKNIVKKYKNIYVKTHPKGHEIRGPKLDVYVMVSSKSKDEAKTIIFNAVSELKKLLRELGGQILEEG